MYEQNTIQSPPATILTTPEDWEYPVSRGKHPALIVDADVHTHSAGYDLVCIRVEILDAPVPGHVETKWHHLNSKKAIQFLKREFAKIGFEVSSPADVVAACGSMKGLRIETNVDYPSGSAVVYFLKRAVPKAVPVTSQALWNN